MNQVKIVSKPKVSAEEVAYRKHLFPVVDIENKNFLCTSCNSNVKELICRGKPRVHRFLETLLCEKCDEFFGDGVFSVDEDGSDKYCRWCGQGGTLYLCSVCTAGFCKKCIKRNLPRSALAEVEDDNWKCYCCDVRPLYDLRALCWAAKTYAAQKKKKMHDNSKKRKLRSRSSSSEEERGKSPERKKRVTRQSKEENTNSEDRSIEKHIKKHINVGALKMSNFLADTIALFEMMKKKGLEVKTRRGNVKSLKSVDSIINCANKVDSILEQSENTSKKMRENLSNYIESWKQAIEEGGETIGSTKDDDNIINTGSSDDGNSLKSHTSDKEGNESDDGNSKQGKDSDRDEDLTARDNDDTESLSKAKSKSGKKEVQGKAKSNEKEEKERCSEGEDGCTKDKTTDQESEDEAKTKKKENSTEKESTDKDNEEEKAFSDTELQFELDEEIVLNLRDSVDSDSKENGKGEDGEKKSSGALHSNTEATKEVSKNEDC